MFQNVQNRKLYQAKSAGEGEPEKNEFSFIKKNHLACSLNQKKGFFRNYKKKSPGLLLILGRCPRRALGRGGRSLACASP